MRRVWCWTDSALLRRNGCDFGGTLLGADCVIASNFGVRNAPSVRSRRHSCATSVPWCFYSSGLTLNKRGRLGVPEVIPSSGNILLLLPIEDLCFHRQEVSLSLYLPMSKISCLLQAHLNSWVSNSKLFACGRRDSRLCPYYPIDDRVTVFAAFVSFSFALSCVHLRSERRRLHKPIQ